MARGRPRHHQRQCRESTSIRPGHG